MPEEIDHAELLAAALEGGIGVDGQTRALTSMAHELRGALQSEQLGAAGRARVYEQSMRLAQRSATGVRLSRQIPLELQARRALERVHIGRKGGVVIGGVAAASVAAAIGFAVVHDRRRRGGVLAHAIG